MIAAVGVVVAGVHLYQSWDDETGLSGSGKSSAPFGPQFGLPRRTETDADGTQREWDGAKWRVKYAPKGSAHAVGSGVMSTESLGEANRVIQGIEGSSGAGGASEGEVTRVGRWMDPAELDAMRASGRVQPGGGGMSRVAVPADASAYKAAKPGDVFVTYDVPSSSLRPAGSGWHIMDGPTSPYGRLAAQKGLPPLELPEFQNLAVEATK